MSTPVDLDKLRSISVSAVAVPSRRRQAAEARLWHYRNELDVPAYRRLRANGVQPPTVHGSYELEKNADTVAQVEGDGGAQLPPGHEFTGEVMNARQ